MTILIFVQAKFLHQDLIKNKQAVFVKDSLRWYNFQVTYKLIISLNFTACLRLTSILSPP